MLKMNYVFEVLEFITEKDGTDSWFNQKDKIRHIGYMKGKFTTKQAAAFYYNKHNPHMRFLDINDSCCTDWDPNTKLLYIIREDYLINPTIDCFSVDDNYKLMDESSK